MTWKEGDIRTNYMMTVDDVMGELGVKRSKAYSILKQLNDELAHNRRNFAAENVDPDRVQLNVCYKNENLKEVYKELFDDAVERYNVGKRKDLQITNYYEKIRHGKQEKLFHEIIFQIGNHEDMAVGTTEGNLAVRVLDEYVKDFQKRNPTLRVFSCYLHQDEATPHLHIDFVPYVTNWKGKGMDTRVPGISIWY